ncbi:hypothetical protein FRB94_012026 [Tulasnella sp. JGI-2019a]|nr:hypothetical protein FRB93_010434 [Tulasnella sp. JGI-2019a]KAG8992084.1 hypothetical protein FRB94_012026 [Tulasnella sp. JGI-2019a]KAG9024179.1 hypothetical protein FRB95_011975 [Tulasnella sp. JGI-2019a]
MSNSLVSSSNTLDTQPVREDMQKLMNEAVVLVRDQAKSVEHDFLEPVYAWYQLNARMYPTTTVFLTVFALLSLLPVTSFIAFSSVVFATCISGALTVAVIATGTVCAVAGTFLLFTLALMLGATILITCTYLCALLAYRLYFHAIDEDGRGVEAWVRESFARFGLSESPAEHGAQEHSLQTRKVVKGEDNNSTDGWAAVEQGQIKGVYQVSKPSLNPAHF